MAILQSELETMLINAFPDATVNVEDLLGDNDHYKVEIISTCFKGLSKVQQHQKVYQVLGSIVGNELHALSLITKCP